MFSSIKFRITLVVSIMIVSLLAILPFVGNRVESATIEAFEIQSKKEQAGLFARLLDNHYDGISSWMRPWMTSENIAPVMSSPVAKKDWGNALLGVGNQVSVQFGINQIVSFNASATQLFDYHVSSESLIYSINRSGLKKIAELTLKDEAYTRSFIKSESGETLIALSIPGEDEDGEINSAHIFIGSLAPILVEFQKSTGYDAELSIAGGSIKPSFKNNYITDSDGKISTVQERKYARRQVGLSEENFLKDAKLLVFVDTTDLQKQFAETRSSIYKGSGIILALFLPLFILIVFMLLKPLSMIVGVTRDIAQGQYEKRVNINSNSEIGKLAVSFNEMVSEIQKSDSNIKSLLAGITEGLFFFDKTGAIAAERSQALLTILPDSERCEDLACFLEHYAEASHDTVKMVLECLWDDSGFMSLFEDTVSMLPKQFKVESGNLTKTIQIEYRELLDERGDLEKVIVFISDISEKLINERKQVILAERIKRISMAAGNLESFRDFYDDANNLIAEIDSMILNDPSKIDLPVLKRELHTFKGNIGTFQFQGLASRIHDLESEINQGGNTPVLEVPKKLWKKITSQWEFETSDLSEVLGLSKSEHYLSIDRIKFNELKEFAGPANQTEIGKMLCLLEQYPASEVLGKYEKMMQAFAHKNNKSIQVVYNRNNSEVKYSEIQKIDGALVHIFRNCIDHGIEDMDTRDDEGKEKMGTISIGFYRQSDTHIELTIQDDGGGISTGRLVEKAVSNEYWTAEKAKIATESEKLNLIFAPSLSTAEKITETSGRGVGMDAVKTIIEDMGGTITVSSTVGEGSKFEIVVPLKGCPSELKTA